MSERDQTLQPATPDGVSLISDYDVYLFKQGRHTRLYEKLGAHLRDVDGRRGTAFAVWAPNTRQVSVIGDFNDWQPGVARLGRRDDDSGLWEGFVADVGEGTLYKYHIVSSVGDYAVAKADPFGFQHETPPRTASIVRRLDHAWADGAWLERRRDVNAPDAPMAVYEMHLGSWRRDPDEGGRPLTYLELARELPDYLVEMGFTHVELMPVTEHPFYGSWGYQVTGYFAPTSRYGTPQEFMTLVDALHQRGIGVILDWVPSHFPSDEHGLAYFDGTHLFEHADPRQGYHPHWNSYIFNYGRYEVRSFLASSAHFWLDRYHIDGLRVDAVASMLYLDYGREDGQWIPNRHGGKENLEAISFLKELNESVYGAYPDVQVIAEESTAWPMVSKPTYVGGLGFGMKWNMGWMHDTLDYFRRDPVHRKYAHDKLTFSIWYAFSESFVLPLSHDEVVHGKGSLIGKMPGPDPEKLANLRCLYGLMYAHPGKKLLFMGAELAQWSEWNHDASLDWHLLDHPPHRGIQRWLQDLNRTYRERPALHELDFADDGFAWIDHQDADRSVISFLRRPRGGEPSVLVACNFTPVPRENYRIGVPRGGRWEEVLNSDAELYGGSGRGNLGGVEAAPVGAHGHYDSLTVYLPPLSVLLFAPQAEAPPEE